MRGTFVFVGAILIAIGVGQLLEREGPIIMIGIGTGFILWGLIEGRGPFSRRHRD
jgi:H+/Cl- antiporter ClcA